MDHCQVQKFTDPDCERKIKPDPPVTESLNPCAAESLSKLTTLPQRSLHTSIGPGTGNAAVTASAEPLGIGQPTKERVEELILIADNIEVDLAALDTCQYNSATIGAQLASIQKSVDQLALGNYSNLTQWVDKLDKKIEAKLAARVEEAIRLWTLVYSASEEVDEYKESNVALPPVHPVLIEIRLTAQTIYISPSIEQARAKLLEQLVEWHAVVTSQPRISSTRFQLAMNRDLNVATYKNVLSHLPNGLGVLENAYTTVDRILREVDEYVNEWLRYQALWDLQAEMLYERLGTDLSKWMKTLVEIRKSRSTFDTQDTKKEIFPVVVDYAKVQLKVTLKYDYWHKEVLQKFGQAVGE
ncbi:hypothetical protein ANCDUO_15331 [Ancylostoma duodenale]|uniref:Dynein heavy chain, region 2 n=1 Tax=Ancylostoma duodenale TaxID=51022 RepID=A0A0C2GC20_9BILA|nr:hypothetical protein ANCDUO_15331 [Ancylostoma duodenale]